VSVFWFTEKFLFLICVVLISQYIFTKLATLLNQGHIQQFVWVTLPATALSDAFVLSLVRLCQCCCQGLETQGRGLENWSSTILEDKDFPQG